MIDFLMIATRSTKKGNIEIYPKFKYMKSKDLMIRGGDFYAIWVADRGLWSTDEQDALMLIDRELDRYAEENQDRFDGNVRVLHMWDTENGMIDRWHHYVQKQLRDSFHMLDEKLIFANSPVNKEDYASKRLNYPLEECSIEAYDRLISTLYSEEERHKIEWAIGSIVTGDSKTIQKFIVMYGSAGTGKSTILNIIQQLFDGYYSVFDAKALGSSSNAFALESFKSNPLVAIQHDGDLSRIEDNTRLNSLVSHELMTVNEKFKSTYANRFKSFLFMGTNKPVKITDAKSGLIRRLIDVTPTGNKLCRADYIRATRHIAFELGGIACHCRDVYLADPGAYDDYIPIAMLGASNDFYNFIVDGYYTFKANDGTSLKAAWEMYKTYCEEARVPYPMAQRAFKEELKNYFENYDERMTLENGERVRSYYSKFCLDKIEAQLDEAEKPEPVKNIPPIINFMEQESIFDRECTEYPAQLANDHGTPKCKWAQLKTKLADIDTHELHYVKVPENHIVIDFDIPDKSGKKCFELNAAEAAKWPPTYAELSKSGQGIHLHYIYTGDPTKLSRIYDDRIEVKVFTGDSSLRRKLTKCNNLPIATISSGLPLKGDDKLINFKHVNSEKHLRTMILKNIDKEFWGNTAPSVSFIKQLLDDAYASDLKYDVSDMYGVILAFAAGSTHQAEACVKMVSQMKFKSEEPAPNVENDDQRLVFYDVEVFPNLFLICWKFEGDDKCVHMFNPTPSEVSELLKYRLVGFNCRRYDNHILYGRIVGYDEYQLYQLSQKIISNAKGCYFSNAYNISYTDVYDFSSKKQSLKKFEIELGIHHQELGLPWDQPVPEELWPTVADYCDNDVISTEATWNARQADFVAREILVDVVKLMHGITMCVNDTTNTLSKRIVFGTDTTPQGQFNWRDMSKPVGEDQYEEYRKKFGDDYVFHIFDENGLPTYEIYDPTVPFKLPTGYSILPFFPGYEFKFGKSTYLGQEIGEGGRVYSKPGMYTNVLAEDVASMHPHSAIAEVVFGVVYTKRFQELVDARVAIKHKDFEAAGKMLNGALKPYLNEDQAKGLAAALKIVINSVYGLTSAKFVNEFRDPNNIDNIIAKRGALFMTMLADQVTKMGYTVAHIKTDCIKVPNADKKIEDFIVKFGKEFGYDFEIESQFDKFCLVNDAVYIAKENGEWEATGTQFAVPYVFKTLFSREPIEFEDLCQTMSVTSALYLDMDEKLPDVTKQEAELKKLKKAYPENCPVEVSDRMSALKNEIDNAHDYHFVGRVGQFCPIKEGHGGGTLLRKTDDGYAAATGSKGYQWLESEMVKTLGMEDNIDRGYYNTQVDKAIETISQFGDFEWFVSDDMNPPVPVMAPWTAAENKSDCPF